MKIKLGTKERTLGNATKNIKAIEDNLNRGVVYFSQQVAIRNVKQSDLAIMFSAGLLGTQDYLEPDEVERLMYETEDTTPIYYANKAVDYMEYLFTAPEAFKKKAEVKEASK